MENDFETYSDRLPQSASMRASLRSTGSFPGVNGSFGSYYRYPEGDRGKEDGRHKTEVNTFPENNNRAVVTALKSLQEKIHKLELDRSQAKANLDQLSSEAKRYQEKLEEERRMTTPRSGSSSPPVEVSNNLATAEAKCDLLERQLEYMRKMLQSAETDRKDAIQRSTTLAQQAAKQASEHVQSKLEKISGLERQHIQLNAAQNVAESKIRELEEKLQEERHKRKLIEDKTAELATSAETNRILMGMAAGDEAKKVKRKKKVKRQPKTPAPIQPHSHYRLNMGNIPFIVGTSTAKSHNVGANIQGALSLLKTHNPVLCNAATKTRRKYCRTSSLASDSDHAADVNEVLLGLQDEFGNMGFEHKELLKQIQDTEDDGLRGDLERELDQLVARMETKGEQIATLKQHQERLTRSGKRKKKRPTSANGAREMQSLSFRGGEVEVVTTVKAKSLPRNLERAKSRPATARQNLDVLQSMRKLQTSLRKDDLSWD
ncbi:centrosomal protein of 57 kDa-like [Dendronephthya gigantea]|uniref:centrosomal protein of 57 kDa-like n=1 Tax=Dendronephthya gigantea TaxID=151771 RepID=UPI00106C9063|nr:centrosomal protein of 57 kDa-like [Dendronephthya gigantea]